MEKLVCFVVWDRVCQFFCVFFQNAVPDCIAAKIKNAFNFS